MKYMLLVIVGLILGCILPFLPYREYVLICIALSAWIQGTVGFFKRNLEGVQKLIFYYCPVTAVGSIISYILISTHQYRTLMLTFAGFFVVWILDYFMQSYWKTEG